MIMLILFQFIANLAILIEFGVVLACIVVKPSSVDSALVTWQCCYSHIYIYEIAQTGMKKVLKNLNPPPPKKQQNPKQNIVCSLTIWFSDYDSGLWLLKYSHV